MAQIVTQSVAADLVAILTDSDNAPVLGLVFSDITVDYRKEGAGSFTNKVLAAPDVVEIGSGVYTIAFTAAELDTLGSFTFKVTGAAIQQYVTVTTVFAAGTTPTIQSVDTCVITGHVFDLGGKPVPGAAVSAKVLGAPAIENDVALTKDLQTTTTDANGEFFLSLVRLAEVELYIPKVNFRRQFTVPNQSTANLFTGIP